MDSGKSSSIMNYTMRVQATYVSEFTVTTNVKTSKDGGQVNSKYKEGKKTNRMSLM